MKDPFTGDLQALQDANRRIAELEHQAAVVFDRHKYEQLETAMRIEARDKRIAQLEKCLFDGLTVTTQAELDVWFKAAETLLEERL